MRVAIFFTCLCFLLLRGDGYAFTVTHDNFQSSLTRHFANKQQLQSDNNTHSDDVAINVDLDDDEEYLISDDIVEEDANNFLVRKYKLLARFHWALSDLFVSGYLSKCYKVPPSFLGYPSYIYLTQGALRI